MTVQRGSVHEDHEGQERLSDVAES
jgi:hypothetical protein